MENYTKGETVEEVQPLPFAVAAGTVVMRVKPGSRVGGIVGHATTALKPDAARHVAFVGTGAAVAKTISCVEIVKRRAKNLHQVARAGYACVDEYWEPRRAGEGLERLKVTRRVPSLAVLLSKDAPATGDPSHQAPGSFDEFWREEVVREKQQAAGKKKKKVPLHAAACGSLQEGVEASTNRKRAAKLAKKFKAKKEKEAAS
ncbi:PREDICTED: ribonuclease P protein subunit p25-like protein [Priapulus caudatus]|uniref:Ribonuclease P protein subunit p25-like protein n=1 Tax=Priapulus caudatus TaxID=37621 RepID=A0ABM1EF45_PRICU|nr:PREDICTED: ribonuclease P protein subunit p25-like protein [Priapulus caudatus]XP_014670816.1 PREDICTED: ribonuclease P protein subunit p25-like protein [Priapulus caudatus]XP_014670817.1 PREDICTED: ribonuclease P protein subunit p25-like protein [Priapulus caudatus]